MDSDDLLRALRESVDRCVSGYDVVAVAYSGGVDSAVIEALARRNARTVCYTCAVRGSHDHLRAPLHAAESGVDLRMIHLDTNMLEDLVSKACGVLGTEDPIRVAYTIPALCVIDRSEEELVLAGNGADELFGGYAKYLEEDCPEKSMERDLVKALAEVKALGEYAVSAGKRFETPFMSGELQSFARDLPMSRKVGPGGRKIILREVARSVGVVSHDAPKKAAQYSSGVMKEMKSLAKGRGKGLREWTAELAAKGRRIP